MLVWHASSLPTPSSLPIPPFPYVFSFEAARGLTCI